MAAALIRQQLGLPDNAPIDEPLGRLARQQGFRMSAIRDIVDQHLANTDPPSSDE